VNQGIPGSSAAAAADLLHRSGPLKATLVAFGQNQRFAGEFRSAYADRFGTARPDNQVDSINFLDRFVLEHRTRDGRTVVEQFVASRPDLPEAERAMLRRWVTVVEGIFEVERHDGDAAIMVNLVDELIYRVLSNAGPQLLERLVPETILWARVVPFGDDWLLSGAVNAAPPEARREMCRAAADMANTCPAAVFRNPDKIALGWELHRRLRGHFIEFFDADLTIVAGHELAGRMAGFWNYHATRISAAASRAPDTSASSVDPDAPDETQPPPVPRTPIPPDLEGAETVGVMFDEVEGLWFLPEYQLVQEVFAGPALITGCRYREAVSGYLRSQTLPPIALRRPAEQDPDRAGLVFARLLGKPRFTWQRDGEALLRQYKAGFFDRTPMPGVTPLSSRQRAFLRPRSDAEDSDDRHGGFRRTVADRVDGVVGHRRHRPGAARVHRVRPRRDRSVRVHRRRRLDGLPRDDPRRAALCVEFTWEGSDEGDQVTGRGWAILAEDGTLNGRIFFHLGDDSGFHAVRTEPQPTSRHPRRRPR
jgi:hypothetical protein